MLSFVIILIGGVLIGIRGMNLGIDYRSGSDITISTNEKVSKNDIKNDIKELGYKYTDNSY